MGESSSENEGRQGKMRKGEKMKKERNIHNRIYL